MENKTTVVHIDKHQGEKVINLPVMVGKILTHTVDLCLLASQKPSIRLLKDIVLSAHTNDDELKLAPEGQRTAFDEAVGIAHPFVRGLCADFKSDIVLDDETFIIYDLEKCETVPEMKRYNALSAFYLGEYLTLDKSTRQMVESAFLGLLFAVLTDTSFSSYCRDRTLNVSAMSLEQKMDVELDVEALQQYFLQKLAVA